MFFVKIPAAEALDLFKIRSNFPVFGVFALSFWTSIIPIIELQKNRRAGRFHSLVWGGYCGLQIPILFSEVQKK